MVLFQFFVISEYIISIKSEKKRRTEHPKVTFIESTLVHKQGVIWTKPIHKILQLYILVLGFLITPHVKFELIWRSFDIVIKTGIKTYRNKSDLYKKGISSEINIENCQILYTRF